MGTPTTHAYGYIGSDGTNNIAEYRGLRAILRRILREAPVPSVIEVDSDLVCRQVLGTRSCQNTELRPLYDECVLLYDAARARGSDLLLRHVYREFNVVADSLANAGTDLGPPAGRVAAAAGWGPAE